MKGLLLDAGPRMNHHPHQPVFFSIMAGISQFLAGTTLQQHPPHKVVLTNSMCSHQLDVLLPESCQPPNNYEITRLAHILACLSSPAEPLTNHQGNSNLELELIHSGQELSQLLNQLNQRPTSNSAAAPVAHGTSKRSSCTSSRGDRGGDRLGEPPSP